MNAETPKKKRPVLILSVIALLTFLGLIAAAMLSLPHLDLPKRVPAPTKAPTEAPTEPTVAMFTQETEAPTEAPTEETVEPTIPPAPTPYGRNDFQFNRNNYLMLVNGESYPGVDVSAFQGDIDWQKVRDSGIRFAMVRLGYRGYGQKGTLVKDEFIDANLKGVTEAGLSLGAYFFSQATNVKEVDEEIEFMLEILGDYKLQMPIVFDWEYISDTARTAHVDARTLTDMTIHFCNVMEAKGFIPMIYFNWHQADRLLHLSELEKYPFWLALYADRMTYPYDIEMWQYTSSGRVPGIHGDVDLNVYLP